MAVFSFFSGLGMLDLGFQEAGFNIVFVNEFEQVFLESYIYARRNNREIPPEFGYHQGDIGKFLTGEKAIELQEYIEVVRDRNEIVGFIGGPPCPDFSVGGKNLGRDGDRGRLAKTYIDLIIQNRPDFFLFENVKGLVRTEKHRRYYHELQDELKQAGYSISDCMLNSLDFGVPQDRERILMLGIRRDSEYANGDIIDNDLFEFPWYANRQYNSEEIKQMPWPVRNAFRRNSRRIFRYNAHIELTVEHWFTVNNVTRHPNSRDVFKVKGGRNKIETIDEGDTSRKSFKRLHRWRYSPTAAYGNNEVHLHPYQERRISVSEAMAIQSLPAWFELPKEVSLTAKFKMVGNGVPYLLAHAIALNIHDYLEL